MCCEHKGLIGRLPTGMTSEEFVVKTMFFFFFYLFISFFLFAFVFLVLGSHGKFSGHSRGFVFKIPKIYSWQFLVFKGQEIPGFQTVVLRQHTMQTHSRFSLFTFVVQ